MTSHPINPWIAPWDFSEPSIPPRRIRLDDAASLVRSIGEMGDASRAAEFALALRRQMQKTLELNFDLESEENRQLADLAFECTEALTESLRKAGGPSIPVELEALVLDDRIRERLGDKAGPDATEEIKANLDTGESSPEYLAYTSYVRGLMDAQSGNFESATEHFEDALAIDVPPSAKATISVELARALLDLGDLERARTAAEELQNVCATLKHTEYELGWAHHALATAFTKEEEWHKSVDAARESNFQFFRFGASQSRRVVGVNYHLVARGMYELEEWGEAAMLAQLSLRSLEFDVHWPSRADSLLLMAKCMSHFGEIEKAKGILTQLIEERQRAPDAEAIRSEAEALLQEISKA